MVERPILFSAPMVRALLAGTKTQTRRICKDVPRDCVGAEYCEAERDWMFKGPGITTGDCTVGPAFLMHCPYGVPGDQLWVRETFYCDHSQYPNGFPIEVMWREENGKRIAIPMDEQRAEMLGLTSYRADGEDGVDFEGGYAPWSPSIHMPRFLSRLTLEITDVRVQRLQDISEEDAKAEGAAFTCEMCGNDLDTDEGAEIHFGCDEDTSTGCASHREGYRRLWNDINGASSWDLNPWVWALTFKRVAA